MVSTYRQSGVSIVHWVLFVPFSIEEESRWLAGWISSNALLHYYVHSLSTTLV